ncbi:hypothetical protein HWI79_178 [Cryptosporidium felis]|nr:hypothetical protein HWI79_178 [Cryptosporidium felis]
MFTVRFLLSIFFLVNNVFCSNFRIISDNTQASSTSYVNENAQNNSAVLSAIEPTDQSVQGTEYAEREMDDVVLQEKPVLLNTIPHTTLNQLLFVNSSGLFTNITVVLTTTVPIATVSSENDSIHRILSISDSMSTLDTMKTDIDEITTKLSNSSESLPEDVSKAIQDAVRFIQRISALFSGNSTYENNLTNTTSNSTIISAAEIN